MPLSFEWEPAKSAANRRKHGVTFEEAQTVFYDEEALLDDDPDHSEDEARFVLLGLSSALRLLLVCHCVRQSGTGYPNHLRQEGKSSRATPIQIEVNHAK